MMYCKRLRRFSVTYKLNIICKVYNYTYADM